MAIRLTKENDHVQYGTTNFVADTDADITSLPTKVTPGSECFCIETSTTYILNNQEEWKIKSQGGGGGSSSYQEKTITPDFSNGNVSVMADRRYKALSKVTIQKDSNLIADNIKKDITVHGIEGNYELSVQEKSLTPNFNQGNVDVTPDNGYDGLSQVTIQKDTNLVAENIKKDVAIHGITGSYEGGSMSDFPELLFTQSSNKASLITHTYTFTESGTFQYYVFSRIDSDTSEIVIKLNGTVITPNVGILESAGSSRMFYGEVTVSANDVITAENTTTNNNYPIQTFIFKKADISRFSVIGFVTNTGQTFSITNQNVPMLHVYQASYYNGRNKYNYQVASYLSQAIPTPNAEAYWYGFTYVITL